MNQLLNLPPKNAAGTKKTLNRFIFKALNLLSYRPRSLTEITTRLYRYGADSTTINKVIDYLTETGKLNDLKFAQWWVDQRVTFKPKGNIALRYELSQKGLNSSVINSVLLSYDDELKLARSLPEKKRLSRGFSRRVIDALRCEE